MKAIPWDGCQITEPGIYSQMPLEIYHSPFIVAGDLPIPPGFNLGEIKTFTPSISSSGLRDIFGEGKSPKHFYSRWQGNPHRIAPEIEPRHFVIGRALHHLVLGEKFFSKLFVLQPEEYHDKKTGELKKWHNGAEYCRAWNKARRAEGRSWLSVKEVESIKQMAISVGNHPLVREGALNGQIERSIFWKDQETGVWLKWRPDAIPTDSGMFTDLKTTISTHWTDLQRTMREFGYYRQAALGRDACRIVLNMEWETFTLIFVEKKEPWHTRDIRAHDDDLHRGARANRAATRIFAKCIKENHWPGPGDGNEGNETMSLSPQAREAMDARLKAEGLADGED